MVRQGLLALVLVGGVFQASDTPAQKTNLPTLIAQLASVSFAERESATVALENAGEDALAPLRAALNTSEDLEVRRRITRITRAIEKKIYGEVRTFAPDTGSLNTVAVAPDGKQAITGDTRGVRVWDLNTGKELRFLDDHGDRVMAVAYSPDGKRAVSASEDRTVRLWDLALGKELACLRGHKAEVRGVAYSADGKWILSGGWDRKLILCDCTGKEQWQATVERIRLFAVAFSPDTRLALSAGELGHLRLWDRERGTKLRDLEGHKGTVTAAVFSHDGKLLLSAGQDGTARLWDVASGAALFVLKGHLDGVTSVAFAANDKTAITGSLDKTLRVWDLTTGMELRFFKGHERSVWGVAYLPGEFKALTVSSDSSMRLWSVGK